MLRIRAILVGTDPDPRIRISDSDPDPAIFFIDLQDANNFFCLLRYFLKVHLHHFIIIIEKIIKIKVFLIFCLMIEGSGGGSGSSQLSLL